MVLRLTFAEPEQKVQTASAKSISDQVFNLYGFSARFGDAPLSDPLVLYLFSQNAAVNFFEDISKLVADTISTKPTAIIINGNIYDDNELATALFRLELSPHRPRPAFVLLDSRAGDSDFRARFFLLKAQIIELPLLPAIELMNQIDAVRAMINAELSPDITLMVSPLAISIERNQSFQFNATANSAVGKPQLVSWFIEFEDIHQNTMATWNWDILNAPCTTTCTAVITGRITQTTPFGNYNAVIHAYNDEVRKSAIIQITVRPAGIPPPDRKTD